MHQVQSGIEGDRNEDQLKSVIADLSDQIRKISATEDALERKKSHKESNSHFLGRWRDRNRQDLPAETIDSSLEKLKLLVPLLEFWRLWAEINSTLFPEDTVVPTTVKDNRSMLTSLDYVAKAPTNHADLGAYQLRQAVVAVAKSADIASKDIDMDAEIDRIHSAFHHIVLRDSDLDRFTVVPEIFTVVPEIVELILRTESYLVQDVGVTHKDKCKMRLESLNKLLERMRHYDAADRVQIAIDALGTV